MNAHQVHMTALKLNNELRCYALDSAIRAFRNWNLELAVAEKRLITEMLKQEVEYAKNSNT